MRENCPAWAQRWATSVGFGKPFRTGFMVYLDSTLPDQPDEFFCHFGRDYRRCRIILSLVPFFAGFGGPDWTISEREPSSGSLICMSSLCIGRQWLALENSRISDGINCKPNHDCLSPWDINDLKSQAARVSLGIQWFLYYQGWLGLAHPDLVPRCSATTHGVLAVVNFSASSCTSFCGLICLSNTPKYRCRFASRYCVAIHSTLSHVAARAPRGEASQMSQMGCLTKTADCMYVVAKIDDVGASTVPTRPRLRASQVHPRCHRAIKCTHASGQEPSSQHRSYLSWRFNCCSAVRRREPLDEADRAAPQHSSTTARQHTNYGNRMCSLFRWANMPSCGVRADGLMPSNDTGSYRDDLSHSPLCIKLARFIPRPPAHMFFQRLQGLR
jgi:hypothetical protein